MLLLATLAGPASGEIVCENRRIPVEVARNVYVIENETRCFHPAPNRLARVKLACDVLLASNWVLRSMVRAPLSRAARADTLSRDRPIPWRCQSGWTAMRCR